MRYEPAFYGACEDVGDWVGRDSEDGATCASAAEDPEDLCVEPSGDATTVTSGDACKATCGGCAPTSGPTRDGSSAASAAPTRGPTPEPPTTTHHPAPAPTTEPDAESAAAPTVHPFLILFVWLSFDA